MNSSPSFKHIKNINRDKNVATMFIYDEISDDHVNGRSFANELNYLVEVEKVTVNVRINSIGGGVMHAFSIFSSIVNANRDGGTVNTFNDGIAASSAGFILLAGKNIHPKDYSRIMIHGVLPVDDDGNVREGLTDKDEAALLNMKDMIKTVIVNKTGLAPDFVEDLLTNGRDNWFTAEEAANLGFFPVENIEKTGLYIDLPEELERSPLQIANKARKIINKSLTKNNVKMKKVIAALKLQDGSSEDVILTAVENALKDTKTAKTALTEAENKVKTLESTISEQKTALEASHRAEATSIIESAVNAGKFAPKNEDEKESLISSCLKDVQGFKNTLALMPTKSANILEGIDNKGGEAKSIIEKVKNRGFRQLEKEDPTLLAEIKNSAKGEYVKLFNEQYKTQKTEADF